MRLRSWLAQAAIAILLILQLAACGGGGDSTVTTITGAGLNAQGLSPAVNYPAPPATFVQTANNLRVVVDAGITAGFSLNVNTNILYATVTVCEPGSSVNCRSIDHIQVDTGSVGLRVLASKLAGLNLPSVVPNGTDPAWECYPFVIGGLWGPTAVADVQMGQQTATHIPIQLIQDASNPAVVAPSDCVSASQGSVLTSAAALGSNGLLGIGSVTLDCGSNCARGDYTGTFVQYWTCPVSATSNAACTSAAVPVNFQTYNPVAALPSGYNNGIVLTMPAVPALGAATASGELIFGINTPGAPSNNTLTGASQVYLGTDYLSNSYLNISTVFQGYTYTNSYLDSGSNALFFNSTTGLTLCSGSGSGLSWYCPNGSVNFSAQIQDGLSPAQGTPVTVNFTVTSADSMFSTSNTAFANLAGNSSTANPSFAWGLPFFYGRRVYLSIWDLMSANGPWYAWSSI